MASPSTQQALLVEMRRTIAATPETLFAAWTDPTQFGKWFPPDPEQRLTIVEMDARTGGAYRIGVIVAPGKPAWTVRGFYKEVTPPKRIVFTWAWDGDDYSWGESVVSIDFVPRGASTEIILKHEGFATEESRTNHEGGWKACLDHIDSVYGK